MFPTLQFRSKRTTSQEIRARGKPGIDLLVWGAKHAIPRWAAQIEEAIFRGSVRSTALLGNEIEWGMEGLGLAVGLGDLGVALLGLGASNKVSDCLSMR